MTDMWVARSSSESHAERRQRPTPAPPCPTPNASTTAPAPDQRLFRGGEAEFLGKVLHDLRGGVGSIVIHSATLADNAEHLSTTELKRELDRLADHGNRLHRLMERLLDVSLHGGRRLDPQPVQLAALVHRVIDAEPWADDHTVSIRIADDLEIVTDPVSLDQILANLLRNAHVHGGSSIQVEATLTGDAMVVSVSDDGPGVPEERRDTLFQPFSARSSTTTGWGLGLAIVAELVDRLDGDIAFRPNAPTGAHFSVTLPST